MIPNQGLEISKRSRNFEILNDNCARTIFSMIKNFTYKTLAKGFYLLGDFICRLDYEWTADLYQKVMNLSLKFDEKIGYQIWEEPLNRYEDL